MEFNKMYVEIIARLQEQLDRDASLCFVTIYSSRITGDLFTWSAPA